MCIQTKPIFKTVFRRIYSKTRFSYQALYYEHAISNNNTVIRVIISPRIKNYNHLIFFYKNNI